MRLIVEGSSMVIAGRTRRDRPALADRGSVARTLRRVGVLTGLAAAGWLLGQAGAVADDLAGPELAPVAEVAFETPGADTETVDAVPEADGHDGAQGSPEQVGEALRDAGERGRAAVETGVPALGSVAEPDGVGSAGGVEAVDAAGTGARDVVENTAQGTGEVVSGTVHAGREVGGFADEPIGESELTETVSDRLTGGAGRIQDELEQTVEEGPQAELGEVTAALAPPRAHDEDAGGGEDARESGDSGKQAKPSDDLAAASARPAQQAPATGAMGAAAAETGGAESAHTADSADAGEPLDGTAWHDSSDSTGTVSPSPVPGAPAGFLLSRGHTVRPVAHRVALPRDPAVVVRYTADDPSFSPD